MLLTISSSEKRVYKSSLALPTSVRSEKELLTSQDGRFIFSHYSKPTGGYRTRYEPDELMVRDVDDCIPEAEVHGARLVGDSTVDSIHAAPGVESRTWEVGSDGVEERCWKSR